MLVLFIRVVLEYIIIVKSTDKPTNIQTDTIYNNFSHISSMSTPISYVLKKIKRASMLTNKKYTIFYCIHLNVCMYICKSAEY